MMMIIKNYQKQNISDFDSVFFCIASANVIADTIFFIRKMSSLSGKNALSTYFVSTSTIQSKLVKLQSYAKYIFCKKK